MKRLSLESQSLLNKDNALSDVRSCTLLGGGAIAA